MTTPEYTRPTSRRDATGRLLARPAANEKRVPSVTVIVLNWNSGKDTVGCLESLVGLAYPDLKIIVVDNGSTDGSIRMIGKWIETRHPDVGLATDTSGTRFPNGGSGRKPTEEPAGSPAVELLQTGHNLGYAGGNNVGIDVALQSGADYVILVNPDVRVCEVNVVAELIKIAEENPNTGILGPRVVGENGNFAHGAGWVSKLGRLKTTDREKIQTHCDFVTGAFFVIRSAVFESVGFLDESFFLYWEETDYCRRVRRAGYEVRYVPDVQIVHRVSSTTGPVRTYYMHRNRVHYVRTNGVSNTVLFVFVLWLTCYKAGVILLGSVVRRRGGALLRIRDMARGYWDGLCGVRGPRRA